MSRRQGHGRLSVELKAALVHSSAQAHDPSALRFLDCFGSRLRQDQMDAVASCALGGVARGGGPAQDAGRASARRDDRDEADADAQGKAFPLPQVPEVFDRAPELAGGFFRLDQGTAFHQDAEFVAAEARKGVAAAQ